ncbi:hypothetical protein C0583_04895 [Candidatus Parcubacteria bacterium]|nr:MAG: hypothetical protein C0583_04895 [Candidatus Parcubacteria bacterium]
MDLSKFKAIFISEVEDQLQKLNTGVLLLEKLNNKGEIDTKTVKDTYNEMMRASHTIKGSSASMGFVKMAFLTHILEDVFDAARNNRLKLNEKMVNLVFKSIDNIENSLNNIKENDEELDFDNFSKKLKKETGVQTEGIGK